MVALVFEIYGAVCVFSLIAFLVLASVAKLRPDLDEEAVDIGAALRPVKRSKRLIQRRPHRIDTRKPRRPNQAA
jgi:hypothetical protein